MGSRAVEVMGDTDAAPRVIGLLSLSLIDAHTTCFLTYSQLGCRTPVDVALKRCSRSLVLTWAHRFACCRRANTKAFPMAIESFSFAVSVCERNSSNRTQASTKVAAITQHHVSVLGTRFNYEIALLTEVNRLDSL